MEYSSVIFDTVVSNVISNMISGSDSLFHNAFLEEETCIYIERKAVRRRDWKYGRDSQALKSFILITFVSVELYRVQRKIHFIDRRKYLRVMCKIGQEDVLLRNC